MKFEDSKTGGVHLALAALCGEWAGSTKTWFEPDVVADESTMTGKMSPILGGRFILHEWAFANGTDEYFKQFGVHRSASVFSEGSQKIDRRAAR